MNRVIPLLLSFSLSLNGSKCINRVFGSEFLWPHDQLQKMVERGRSHKPGHWTSDREDYRSPQGTGDERPSQTDYPPLFFFVRPFTSLFNLIQRGEGRPKNHYRRKRHWCRRPPTLKEVLGPRVSRIPGVKEGHWKVRISTLSKERQRTGGDSWSYKT